MYESFKKILRIIILFTGKPPLKKKKIKPYYLKIKPPNNISLEFTIST